MSVGLAALAGVAAASIRTMGGTAYAERTPLGIFSFCQGGTFRVTVADADFSEAVDAEYSRIRVVLERGRSFQAAAAGDSEPCPCPEEGELKCGDNLRGIYDVLGPCASRKLAIADPHYRIACSSTKPLPAPTNDTSISREGPCDVVAGTTAAFVIPVGGFYAATLLRCNCPGVPETATLEYQLHITEANPESYAPCGERPLVALSAVLTVVYAVLSVVWTVVVVKRREYAHRIHILMCMLVFSKALTELFDAVRLARFAATGASSAWALPYYLFHGARGFLLFLIMLLLGSGWSILKSHLSQRDRIVLGIVLPLQVVENVAYSVMCELIPGSPRWLSWRTVLYVVDVMCCVIILFPVVSSMGSLRDAVEVDGKAARALVQLKAFTRFYICVIVYVYYSRIMVVLVETALPHNITWVGAVLVAVGTLTFYSVVGVWFAPRAPTRLYDQLEDVDLTGLPERTVLEFHEGAATESALRPAGEAKKKSRESAE